MKSLLKEVKKSNTYLIILGKEMVRTRRTLTAVNVVNIITLIVIAYLAIKGGIGK